MNTTSDSSEKKDALGKKTIWQRMSRLWESKPTSTEGFRVKAVVAASEMTDKAGELANAAVSKIGKIGYKAVEIVGDSAKLAMNTMLNTSKFVTNSTYRHEVAYPWIRSIVRENWQKIGKELSESEDMLKILWKYAHGKAITETEANAAKAQLYDIMRVIPALAIFAVPGGALLLPLLARALPWDLMPSSFRQKMSEEYGQDALSEELRADEEIPMDPNATDLVTPAQSAENREVEGNP